MDKEILKKQIKKGYSSYKISESLNKSQTTIRYWLKKHNLKTHQSYGKPHLCEDCGEANPNKFYPRQKQKCKKCHNQRVAKDCKNKRIKAIELLGGSCQVCGYDKCSSALEFHHIDPTIKDVNFSTMRGWTFSRIKKELDNCILLCANCHREEHERLRQN
jgi:5-methylcytosine-specific restriction endonuclease McrA